MKRRGEMKKTVLLLVANLLIFSSLMSQVQETKAENILDKVASKTTSYNTVKIIFSYSMDNEEQDIHENYRGEIISKGDKYRLKVAGQEIINNGKKVWTYIPDAQEVQLNNVSEENTRFNPTQLIRNYKANYETELIEKTKEQNRKLAVIKLIPKNENETFKRAHLVVDTTRDEIYKLIIFGDMGNKFTYTVEELLPNISVPEDSFRFSKENHPDVDIIDMR